MQRVLKLYTGFLKILKSVSPFLMLILRIWIAAIFWRSGMTKIADWDSTLYLFNDEYSVPLLPPMVAAVVATCFELACPVLLILGLAARLAALPLIGMTAVIQFTYSQDAEHVLWALLLGAIVVYGADKISLDAVIARVFQKKSEQYQAGEAEEGQKADNIGHGG